VPQKQTLRVKGYREFLIACDHAGKETKREVRGTFRKVGDLIKADAQPRYRPSDAKSAAGLRTVVRQRGVSVEQSLRKTTGKHPEWGSWQMRHTLVPALDAKEGEVERELEHAIDRVADHFDTKGI
jgi:hypothetical protein